MEDFQLEKISETKTKKLKKLQVLERFSRRKLLKMILQLLFQSGLGIPVSRMLEEEAKKLSRMEEELKKQVVGQDEAVKRLLRQSNVHEQVLMIHSDRLVHLFSLDQLV